MVYFIHNLIRKQIIIPYIFTESNFFTKCTSLTIKNIIIKYCCNINKFSTYDKRQIIHSLQLYVCNKIQKPS